MSALAIMLTRRCNMQCAHCSVESGPKTAGTEPSREDLLGSLRTAAEEGVRSVILTGGEPMLREEVVLELLRECRRLGLGSRIATNGFWGRTEERARRTLVSLVEAGLGAMTVSYDRFHAAFQGPEPVVNIARAALEICVSIDVNVTRMADDGEIEALVTPFASMPSVRLRFYDVQPVGAARHFDHGGFRSETEGFCSACAIPALTDDGRLTACNGPSYFLSPKNPLVVGSLADASLSDLLARHREDPILDTIRTKGPTGLRDAILDLPELAEFPFKERYSGMCDLCHHITSSPQAVAALHVALSAPERAAERVARQRLIDRERDGGTLSRSRANADGAARVFLAIAAGEPIDPEIAGRVLGRADLDWRARAERLIAAGLARPFLQRLEDPGLARWAPALFGSLLRRAAVVDEARELRQLAELERLAEMLRARGGLGTVIGGAACWAWEQAPPLPRRAVSAIEVIVADPDTARQLGGSTAGGAEPAAVVLRSEIAPPTWGLPEAAILDAARPLPDGPLRALRRVLPADSVVIAMVKAFAEGLHGGVEAAFDASVALAEEPLDQKRARSVIGALASPRAFWVTARVLADRVGVRFPDEFLAAGPNDARQRRLEWIAARHLFRDVGGSSMAEWTYRWAWPALAAETTGSMATRLPGVAARALRELPRAWRDIGSDGVAGAASEARRVLTVWTSAAERSRHGS